MVEREAEEILERAAAGPAPGNPGKLRRGCVEGSAREDLRVQALPDHTGPNSPECEVQSFVNFEPGTIA